MTVTRAEVVKEALSWLKTPYSHEAMLKGVGVDCGTLLIGVYSAVGLVEPFKPASYPPDFHLHRGTEMFAGIIEKYCDRLPATEALLPGDIVILKYGWAHAHGCIVEVDDVIIHAVREAGEVVRDRLSDLRYAKRDAWKYRPRGLE